MIDFDQEKNTLLLFDDLRLKTASWLFKYDTTKKAYKIYTEMYQNKGMYYENGGVAVSVDNIDLPDESNLRPYWTVEYNVSKGGYIIRSLRDPTQVLDLKESKLDDFTPIITYGFSNNNNQIWNLAPISDKE